MEQNRENLTPEEGGKKQEKQEKKISPAGYSRMAGYAFIGAGTAWLLTDVDRVMAISLIALGIVFLVQGKTDKEKKQ